MNANGAEANASGQNTGPEKYPALEYFTTAISATRILSVRAAGFMIAGATPNNAIAAR